MTVSLSSCPICRFALPPNAAYCRACGKRLTPGAATQRDELPPIWITTEQGARLDSLARRYRPVAPALCDFLLSELRRAAMCPPGLIPPDVVTMNSRVDFRAGDGSEPYSRVLVYPDCYEPTGTAVSILSPLGAALIGLAAGSRMTYCDRQGDQISVEVLRVPFQPEAKRGPRFPEDDPPAAA